MVVITSCVAKTVLTPSGSSMTLRYCLLETYSNSNSFYGIRIDCFSTNIPQPDIYSEEVSHISDSFPFVYSLFQKCAKHLVTPTDLFTALDILMDPSF